MIADLDVIPEALPGAPLLGDDLRRRLAVRLQEMGADYEPRTRHHRPDGSPQYTNRLFLTTSPYLLQHAHNPVNWFPWGDEAFELAAKLNRPVLLSIGYSTCHWCHVMEEETFEDPEIAAVLNELYIPIKVDREVRPDVDAIYMQAVRLLSGGRGGWPLNVWLTPDREPFYGGTYFPARDGDRGTRTGFLTIIKKLSRIYQEEPERVTNTTGRVVPSIKAALEGDMSPADGGLPGVDALDLAAAFYAGQFDPVEGGLNRAPKFPSSLPVRFLLRSYWRTGDAKSLSMVSLSLRKMADGGMYDQVAGGFHRYSTDAKWLVPHFEKMLYDNALLAVDYLEGWQVTGDEQFARITAEILRYVGRDMTAPGGAFYSATDADSRKPDGHVEEGWFFTWTPDELEEILGRDDAQLVTVRYGVTQAGNFEGRNILHVTLPLTDVAAAGGLSVEETESRLQAAREKLYEARKARPAPLRDDKILVAWNGLMISAFARAGLAMDNNSYVEAAANAADFILLNIRDDNGRLWRSYKDGKAENPAFVEDYAFFIAALLDLYEAHGDPRWLREGLALQEILDRHYADGGRGGYYATADDHEELLAREKPARDGAEPSGNSVAALNLLRLATFTTDDRFRAAADQLLTGFAPLLTRSPAAVSEMLLALDWRLGRPREVVVVTAGRRDGSEALLAPVRRGFLPNRVLAVVPQRGRARDLEAMLPLLQGKVAQDGRATAYVCEHGVCQLPTTDPEVLAKQLAAVKPL
ncbi:MAG: thioredoxin domain-containing protein [Acidobacteria bacterium]|nr:thioredoxin domain-containing protein [Acidobacteriota bacterium]